MDATVPVSEARATLPELLERVSNGDEVTLTRHGVPVAVLVRPDSLGSRRLRDVAGKAAEVREALERGRAKRLGPPSLTAARAEELVAEVETSRAAR